MLLVVRNGAKTVKLNLFRPLFFHRIYLRNPVDFFCVMPSRVIVPPTD